MLPAGTGSPAPRQTNWDALRLACTLYVIYFHLLVLTGCITADESYHDTGWKVQVGRTALQTFFFISGYFNVHSLLRTSRPWAFAARRAARVFPALWLQVLVVFVVFRLIVTAQGQPEAMPLAYFHSMWTIFPVEVPLNHILQQQTCYFGINDSLWTIALELQLYLVATVLAAFGVWRWLQPRLRWLLLPVVGLAAIAVGSRLGMGFRVSDLMPAAITLDFALLWGMFAIGAGYALWERHLHRHWLLAVLALLVTVVCFWYREHRLAMLTVLPYLHWYICNSRWQLPHFPDLTYGLYIYAFPIQQAIILAFGKENVGLYEVLVSSLVAIVIIAWLSYRYVEQPVLLWVRNRLR